MTYRDQLVQRLNKVWGSFDTEEPEALRLHNFVDFVLQETKSPVGAAYVKESTCEAAFELIQDLPGKGYSNIYRFMYNSNLGTDWVCLQGKQY